jgi:hypothetical protein
MKRSSPLLGLSHGHHEALVLARRAAGTLPASETARGQRELFARAERTLGLTSLAGSNRRPASPRPPC